MRYVTMVMVVASLTSLYDYFVGVYKPYRYEVSAMQDGSIYRRCFPL